MWLEADLGHGILMGLGHVENYITTLGLGEGVRGECIGQKQHALSVRIKWPNN